MTVPTISNLPTVPATSDPNFETEAPALFNHIKNTFVSEMNSAISFINSSTFDATVEFKNANFTAARNFLYMIDTSSAGVSVTLPLNPSTGDQLLLMDQKRSFGTNNLTIVRNGQNINGAASDVVSKSTGALIRCIFQSSYGWTVDLYEGEWESGTTAGDLVYNGGKVGIGTSAPSGKLDVNTGVMSGNVKIGNFDNVVNGNNTSQLGNGTKLEFIADTNPRYSNHDPYTVAYVKAEYDGTDFDTKTGDTALTFATYDGYAGASNGVLSEKMRITSAGNVGIGTSAPSAKLHVYGAASGGTDITTIKAANNGGADVTLIAYQNSHAEIRLGTAHDLLFKTNDNNERCRVTNSGDFKIKNGNLVIQTAGKGIDFSANSHATNMSSELFDSYEEGTFTPAFEPDSGSFTSITYNRRTGNYTKIGNTVHCWIDISTDLLTVGTASGGIHISGLPFTITAHSTALVGAQSGWITKAPDHAAVQSGQTRISLRWLDQSTQNYQNITTSNLKTGTNQDANRLMGISFSYKTS